MPSPLCRPITATVTARGVTRSISSFADSNQNFQNWPIYIWETGYNNNILVYPSVSVFLNTQGFTGYIVRFNEGGYGFDFGERLITPNTTQTYTDTSVGSGTVSVTIAWGSVISLVPTVTSISPNMGSTAGGTSITITGTNFITGATGVTIGGVAATNIVVVNSTTITATTPAGSAGTASVLVTTTNGTNVANTLFSYVVVPTVTSISPTSGSTYGGGVVTISGANFTGVTSVTIRGVAANYTLVNSTTITATTPANTEGTASILVTTSGGTNSANTLFTYIIPAPFVTSVSPIKGTIAGGTSVIITGTGFTGATAVTFGGTSANSFVVNSPTKITAVSPAGTGSSVSVLVTTPGGTNVANTLFSYSSVDGFNPCNAPPNTNDLPFSFPLTPSLYQVYSFSGRAWVWANYAWKRYCQ